MPARPIFRPRAIEEYRRRTEKDIVPRLVGRPIIVCAWILLVLLVGAAALAWSIRIPTYLSAPGLVVGPQELRAADAGAAAVLFLPPDQSSQVLVGRTVKMRIGSSDTYAQGAIAQVESGAISPEAARERYRVEVGSDLITEPSVVATVRLGQALPAVTYAGSRITAEVDSGSQRLLALLPGFARAAG
ncbi:hypothetical protein [Amycolatopsis pithecellobii]|uniref:HlyD family efflux transporter periplasmic adaptor subunit n=1 Tax=Amycolatopsis pithecellobii TaxID=664692 RepID=A0A6N7YP17_9PSEU|nr:hypothetical protein [Amycolatopsis pithecellobii]MTD53752.1 hypothetical protein [Amycolatopsis pithecellobii]